MRTVCIIQSRLGSTRFPRKALADINGKPMIQHVVERALRIKAVDEVCIATVPADEEAHQGFGVKVYAPAIAEDDVLARFAWVKTRLGAHLVVRITGDCPLFDPDEASKMIDHMLLGAPGDYITNRRPDADGKDVEVVSAKALHIADDEATTPFDREHVTPYIYTHPERFALRVYHGFTIPNGEKWSVDTPEDLELVRARMRGVSVRVE